MRSCKVLLARPKRPKRSESIGMKQKKRGIKRKENPDLSLMHVHTHDLIIATNEISPTICLFLIRLRFNWRTNKTGLFSDTLFSRFSECYL